MKPLCATLILCALAGCAAQSAEPDPETCSYEDRACPADLPLQGAPCIGELSCPYAELTTYGCTEPAQCIDGHWQIACFFPGPILAERCRDPQLGPFDGVAFELSAVSESIAWGLQGGAMVGYSVDAIPGDWAPDCVRVTARVEIEGMSETTVHDVRLRCGRSLPVQEILPMLPCEERDYDVHLEVSVEGMGSRTVDFTVRGGNGGGFPPVCDPTFGGAG